MADESDTPTPPVSGSAPATPRRRAPRKTTGAKSPSKPKTSANKVDAKPTTTTATKAPSKPRSTKRSAPRSAAKPAARSRVATAAHEVSDAVIQAEERATKVAKTAARRTRTTAKKTSTAVSKATDKVGGKWGAAAIAGGVAAIGAAATAALLSLRSSSAKSMKGYQPALLPGGEKQLGAATPSVSAHQPDGTDASKSFEAGIADENTIPDAGTPKDS